MNTHSFDKSLFQTNFLELIANWDAHLYPIQMGYEQFPEIQKIKRGEIDDEVLNKIMYFTPEFYVFIFLEKPELREKIMSIPFRTDCVKLPFGCKDTKNTKYALSDKELEWYARYSDYFFNFNEYIFDSVKNHSEFVKIINEPIALQFFIEKFYNKIEEETIYEMCKKHKINVDIPIEIWRNILINHPDFIDILRIDENKLLMGLMILTDDKLPPKYQILKNDLIVGDITWYFHSQGMEERYKKDKDFREKFPKLFFEYPELVSKIIKSKNPFLSKILERDVVFEQIKPLLDFYTITEIESEFDEIKIRTRMMRNINPDCPDKTEKEMVEIFPPYFNMLSYVSRSSIHLQKLIKDDVKQFYLFPKIYTREEIQEAFDKYDKREDGCVICGQEIVKVCMPCSHAYLCKNCDYPTSEGKCLFCRRYVDQMCCI